MAHGVHVFEPNKTMEVLSLASHEANREIGASYFRAIGGLLLLPAVCLLITQHIDRWSQLLTQKCMGVLISKHRCDAFMLIVVIRSDGRHV